MMIILWRFLGLTSEQDKKRITRNIKDFFPYYSMKNICDPSLKPSGQDGVTTYVFVDK